MKKFKLFDFCRIFCLINLLFIVFLISGCKENKSEKSILALDTVVTITAEGENAKDATEKACEFVMRLDKLAGFEKGSELKLLNKATDESFLEVSPEIYALISLGKYYTDFTKQAYDVSGGKLVELWDEARKSEELPQDVEILTAKNTLSAKNIALENGKIKKSTPNTEFTLGGIAKGYAADIVYSLYKANNVTGFLNFGTSTILACGDKTYRVGIKNPRNESDIIAVVPLKNAAMSTSGDYERYFIKDNVRYHHIIDPKTGYPANSGIASATVIAPLTRENAGAMSDALSTALVVLGTEGASLLDSDIKAVLVTVDGKIIEVNGEIVGK